jgi:SAM-dependent methyltransferase
MENARTEDVKRLYECYPYPYSAGNTEPDLLLTYLFRQYFFHDPLAGWRILDAGCGTGHKLIGLATTYPKAHFVGLELSAASVAVARRLAQTQQLSNVEIHQGNLLELTDDELYDVVQAFGVVHHLEDPQRGLNNLGRALRDNGILSLWLYHPFGEFERLAQRELLLTLWGGNWQNMSEGQMLMEQLGLHLEATHYGPRDKEANALAGNADAFMHPIVHAYRFSEALTMLRRAGMTWVAFDFVNLPGTVKLINLAGVHDPFMGSFCIGDADVLPSPDLQARYRTLAQEDRLKVIELTLRPRGFQLLAGKGQSYRKVAPRLRGNVMQL